MGRRPKLTPELQKKIVGAIAAGNFNDVAAQYAGIVPSTFYRWITEGEAACSGIKKEFSDAVKEAAARAQIRMVAIINTAANQSWQAAAWWLERKYYQDWGRKQQVMGEGGGPIQHGVTFTELLIEASKEDGEDGGNG